MRRIPIRHKNSEFAALHNGCKEFIVGHKDLIPRHQVVGLVPLILIGVIITEMVFDDTLGDTEQPG